MKKSLLTLFFILIAHNLALADVIYLKNKTQIKGEVSEVNQDMIIIKTDYGLIHIGKDQISKIEYNQTAFEKQNSAILTEPEKWYLGILLGAGASHVNTDLISSLQYYSLANKSPKETDILFYGNIAVSVPFGNNILLGLGYSIWLRTWEETSGTDHCRFTLSTDSFNVDFKYFSDEILNGFFFTISPGIGEMVLSKEQNNLPKKKFKSRPAFTIKGGPGYSFSINRFNSAFSAGIEGFYSFSRYDNAPDSSKNIWTIAGVYAYFGWIW